MPTGYPKRKPGDNPEYDRIMEQVKELKERAKQVLGRSTQRQRLLRFCKVNGFDRSDVTWVHAHLPIIRISRKMRLERIAKSQQNPTKKKRDYKAEYKRRYEG